MEKMENYTVNELREIFAGCETATNIVADQIGDHAGVAIWYPWDRARVRIPATPRGIIEEVQDAWDAAGDLPGRDEVAALNRIARAECAELRDQYRVDENCY